MNHAPSSELNGIQSPKPLLSASNEQMNASNTGLDRGSFGRTSFGSLARTNSTVSASHGGTLAPTGVFGGSNIGGNSTSTIRDIPASNYRAPAATRQPPVSLSHLESGFTHNVSALSDRPSTTIHDVLDVDGEDDIDFDALVRLETAAAARAVVRSNLPSTSSECTSQFDSIPPHRNVPIEQYDPTTAQTSKWHGQHFEWSSRVNNVIQRTFGHQQWRTNQLEIVNAIMAKKNVFVTMPTGGGKSLCYQVPALASPGVTVVIQPLISLIEDQMMILTGLDIPCKFLCGKDYDGPWGTPDFGEVYNDILSDPPNIKILFITPERLTQGDYILSRFGELGRQEIVSLFVVDECHCVSQWGHEFRPSYKDLSKLKEHCPTVPVLALTATATIYVKVDILTVLRFFDDPRNLVCFTSSFNRPNLYFEVRPKTKTMRDEIAELIHGRPGQSGIVYCLSRADCEEFANDMQARGFNCGYYHAHVPTKDRAAIQAAWYNNELQFICATIAFGMGINKPDVRWVVHASIPKSLEGFYQEAGRAGRDGNPADCIVFSSGKDMITLKRMALSNATHDPYRLNDPVHANLMRLTQLATFLEDRSVCRRTLVTQYFGERDPSKGANYNCGNCDTCNNSNHAMTIDVSSLAKSILTEYREILKEPETVARAPKEKGKRNAAPKASHYKTQVSSGTLRERCIANGSLAFLSRHGIKTKGEMRAFFDYVFGKLIMNGIFIDVSSIGMLGKKGSASKMRFPPCHFMFELPQQNTTVLNNFERAGCKLTVVWKHPAKGMRVWTAGEDDEDDIVEDHAPAPKRAKRAKSVGGTAEPAPRTKVTEAKKSSAKKSTSTPSSAKKSAQPSIASFPAFSKTTSILDDELSLDYEDHMDIDEPYNPDDYDEVDEYAMNIDLDQINHQRSAAPRNPAPAPSSSISLGGQFKTTSTSTNSGTSSLPLVPGREWASFVLPPPQTSAKRAPAGIITVNDDIDDLTGGSELAKSLRTPQDDRSASTSQSPKKSIFGRPKFVTPSSSLSAKPFSIDLDSYQDTPERFGSDDDDDVLLGWKRHVPAAVGPVDPQAKLREKLVNEMKQLRTQIGKEESYNASGATQITSLFPDNVLLQIAYEMPRGLHQFTSVNGVGEKRSEKYGGRFVFVIEQFVESHPELKPLPGANANTIPAASSTATSSTAKRTTSKGSSKLGYF
jgi:bloom syndrome protein